MLVEFDYLMKSNEICSKLYKHLICLDQVDSTNKFALNLSEKEHGICIYSKNQLDGRGREGRFWHAKENKSLALSILLDYPKNDRHKSLLPILAANSVCKTLEDFKIKSSIKWPNDILVNANKISGILCEAEFTPDKNNYLVVGIGININLNSEDFLSEQKIYKINPTSMSIQSGYSFEIDKVCSSLLVNFANFYHMLDGNEDEIINFYNFNWGDKGKILNVQMGDKLITGKAISINSSGELLIKKNDKDFIINSGEIISSL